MRGVTPISNSYTTRVTAAALVLLGALWASTASAASGEVLALSGSPVIETGSQKRAAAVGDSVETGDTIDAPEDTKVRLRMNDGSIVTIAAGTRLTIDKYDVDASGSRQAAELSLSKGLVRSVVSSGGETPNFEIKTATGVAAVRGTEWYVDAEGQTTKVYVVTGNVSLADPAGANAVTIPPMSASSVDAHKKPTPVRPITQDELQALVERTAFYDGLCQCLDQKSIALGSCLLTSEACKASCAAVPYSFVPYARGSCGNP
ncbi:MAG TPA: FecR family protein [Stellaceae bacterium]|nr:FecR family protein [Stellaceae bacterium]